ncbi:MAG: hypothetical protein DIZ80_02395 [endosymbiont of Galathealinum brachiosum]|uniref:LysM domain-containing protein n=1 Tax=endosymbiont of Galathealinum brachiosum TaxID=2200906 RepID=A0A370DMA8_9GAMM|nr:MAG: hypothetical protein DIZ80_02395 [endosymbiont of Galathealinum brachiosum]
MPKRWDPQGYTVKRGDTLYSIAWRYEKDFRQVAEINNIQSPYAIYPGQRLRMQPADKDGTTTDEIRPQVLTEPETGKAIVIETPEEQAVVASATVSRKKASHATVQKNDTLYGIARREGYSHHQLARWNHLQPPYALKPGQKLRLSPTANSLGGQSTSIAAVKPVTKPITSSLRSTSVKAVPITASVSKKPLPVKVDRWHWPAKGRVVKTYKANEPSRKGIGITGKSGQPVKAAAAGTVVYSGNGLINYGNLVIIKHSHSFLSAYAYNQSLLVKEGDSVKRGQSIARMGKLNSKPQLHFEIRRNGKPVNPLHYLPRS